MTFTGGLFAVWLYACLFPFGFTGRLVELPAAGILTAGVSGITACVLGVLAMWSTESWSIPALLELLLATPVDVMLIYLALALIARIPPKARHDQQVRYATFFGILVAAVIYAAGQLPLLAEDDRLPALLTFRHRFEWGGPLLAVIMYPVTARIFLWRQMALLTWRKTRILLLGALLTAAGAGLDYFLR